jgi:23S rRNA (uracil1939-C5)-methyltransferase
MQDGDGAIQTLHGAAYGWVRLRGRDLALRAGSFFQSNWSLLPALLDRALELAAVQPGQVVADIYGGVGLFGLFMAEQGADVTMIEIDPRAVESAKTTAAAWGLSNLRFVASSAERAVAGLPRLDLALVDPPRTGLDERTISALIEREVPRIVYVSCSPISYARDAARLVRAGYTIERYELFDFYPQTVHIEGLALFTSPPSA